MKRILLTVGAASALVLSLPAAAQPQSLEAPSRAELPQITTAAPHADDAAFVADAISTDIAEMKLGQLAQQKGESGEVRDFGKVLAADHGKSMKTFIDIATDLKVPAPTTPSREATQDYDRLAALSGKDFDDQFLAHMVMGHQKAIAVFKAETKGATSAKVAGAAQETLPTLNLHLETAQSLLRKSGS